MMIQPRWRKVIADLWGNMIRTLVTVLTIALGLLAVGFVGGMLEVMLPDMNVDYQVVNPHAGIIYTSSPFDDTLLASLRQVPGVESVEGRSSVIGRVATGKGDQKITIYLMGLTSAESMHIDRLRPVKPGESLVVGEREVLLESSAARAIPTLKEGGTLTVELEDGRTRDLRIRGFARDVTTIPAYVGFNAINAYVSPKTIDWMGGSLDYTQLYFTVSEQKTSKPHVEAVGRVLKDKLEKGGRTAGVLIYNPGRHFAADITQGMASVLGVLGGLLVFLSTSLIFNTINAIMAQHIRQIGIMKAVGGRTGQIVSMYLALVTGFGLLALILAVPLSALLSYLLGRWMSGYLNFQLQGFRIPPMTTAVQVALALGVPLLAAIFPVLKGTRMTIREAMASYGLGKGRFGRSWLDRFTEQIHFLSRPLLISLRNTIRRKTRLALTLVTLTLAGAIFIGVMNLRTAFAITLKDVEGYFMADVNLTFSRPYRFDKVEALARQVPGIVGLEGWGYSSGQLLSPDKETATEVQFLAPRSDSKLIRPILITGRWLTPQDENAIVVGPHLLLARSDLKVGDTVIIKIDNRETTWQIVGVYQIAGNATTPLIYANYEYLSRITNQMGRVGDLRVITTAHDAATQTQVGKQLEAVFKQTGVDVAQTQVSAEWRRSQTASMDIFIVFMMAMAVAVAVVGGLGLMGTMSMNVLERTREIGVMRSIGASDRAIFQLVMVEGMLIGILSWLFAIVVAIPITYVLNEGVGVAILTVAMQFAFGWEGLVLWLIAVAVLSALSSRLPAWNAVRLTVREVLAYQ